MEIGQERVGGAKAVARRDENGGVAGERLERTVLIRRTFQQTQCRRADGNDAAAFRPHCVQGVRGRSGHLAPFRMHTVRFDVVGLDRQECPCADMQRHAV